MLSAHKQEIVKKNNLPKDKRIDSFTIHQNKIKDSSNLFFKNQNQTHIYVLVYRKMEGIKHDKKEMDF